MSAHRRFAPVLRYLAEAASGMYAHPSMPGLHGGQEVWADPHLQFDSHADARVVADLYGGQVVKLRVSAAREPVRKGNRPDLSHVPTSGQDAFAQGWDTKACPHDPSTVEAMLWMSDWWRANAEAFASHIGQHLPTLEDGRETAFRAGFSAAWSMGGYGDYQPNEDSSWEEFRKS